MISSDSTSTTARLAELARCDAAASPWAVLARHLAELQPNTVVVVNRVDPQSRRIRVVAVEGTGGDRIRRVADLLGFDPFGHEFDLDPATVARYAAEGVIEEPDGLRGLAAGALSPTVIRTIERVASIKRVYTAGMLWQQDLNATVHLLLRGADELHDRDELTEYLIAASAILQRDAVSPSRRLQWVIEGTAAGTWEWNVQTGETVFDRQWAKLIGYDLAELQPTTIETWQRLTHPDDLKAAQAALEAHFRGETDQYALELRMRHKDGRWVWIQDRGRVFEWTDDRKPLRMFGTHIDVSDRKRAEAELSESHELLQTVFDGLQDGMAVLDANLEIRRVNTWMEELFGVGGPAEGRRCYQLFHGRSAPCASCPVLRAGARREPASATMPVTDASGESRWIQITVHPLFAADGALDGFVEHVKDVTERIEREAAALAASRAKSAFLASMSHELRTPLNGIVGFSDVLMRSELPAAERRYVENIHTSAETLMSLINDILDFSKIEAGHLDLASRRTDLFDLLHHAIATVRFSAESLGLELLEAIDERLPRFVEVDDTRLMQVLVNLLGNAVKFTEHGHVKLAATVIEPPTEMVRVRFAVEDTGVGIEQQHLAEIFESFVQADSSLSRRHGGTGLGLSISSRIIAAMAGRIHVTSEVDQGSTFWFDLSLPVAREEDPASPGEQEGGAEYRHVADTTATPPTILLAEDERINALVVRTFIERISPGANVIVATNGAEAVERFAACHPDIVLMDIQMPELDGYSAARAIRDYERSGEHVPVVALTAGVTVGERDRCLSAGMDDYMSKPIVEDDLRSLLGRWLSTPDAVAPGDSGRS